MPTNHPPKPCPHAKNCYYRANCEKVPGIFLYWNAFRHRCVSNRGLGRIYQDIKPESLKNAKYGKPRKIRRSDRLIVVDETGKELSNKDLRKMFGQGKGVRLR